LKAKANSIANLSYNLLGYLPAPFLYGICRDYFSAIEESERNEEIEELETEEESENKSDSTAGMSLLMWMTVVSISFLITGMMFRKIVPATGTNLDDGLLEPKIRRSK